MAGVPNTGWRSFGIENGNLVRTMGNYNYGSPPDLWQTVTEACCYATKRPGRCEGVDGRGVKLSADDRSPCERGACGLYMFRQYEDHLAARWLRPGGRVKVGADIALEGKVLPTTNSCGYVLRGERARLLRLFARPRDWDVAEPVAARLGVPLDTLEALTS